MTTRPRLMTALAPLALLAACGGGVVDHRAAASAAFAIGDFPVARREALAALGEAPKDAAMLDVLVRSLLRMGDPEGAESAIGRLRRAGGKGPAITRFEAEILLMRDRDEDALALLGDDASAEAWRIRAAARIRQGDADGALAMFQKGYAAGPDARFMSDYVRFLLDASELAGAQRVLARLAREDPGGYDTQMLTGMIAERGNDQKGALAAYARAARALPGRYEPLLAQAQVLDAMGRSKAAEALVGKAAALAPGAGPVRSMKLQLLAERGEWARIRDLLQGADWSIDPRSADGMTYGEALLNLGHPEQARAMFQRTVLLWPDNRYARMMLARAQLAAGEPDKASATMEPLLDGVLVLPPEIELAEQAARAAGWEDDAAKLKARRESATYKEQVRLAGEGLGAGMRGDWAGAVSAYRALLALGEDVEVLRRLAGACSKAGLGAEAIAHADRALALRPDDSGLSFLAGKVRLSARRDLPKAVVLLGEAADAEPRNLAMRAALEQAKAAAR